MSIPKTSAGEMAQRRFPAAARVLIAVVVAGLAGAYCIGIVTGTIPPGRKLDATTLTILALVTVVIALLIWPEAFGRVKVLRMTGFELQLLESVQEKQREQEGRLDELRLILPLLLPGPERDHLLNLARRKTAGYKGGGSLRDEIRRLRSMGLLRMKGGRNVSEMTDSATFDLAHLVELTGPGELWVKRIGELEEGEVAGQAPGPHSP